MSANSISQLYAAGVSIVGSSPSYDNTQPEKGWTRALQSGENATDDYLYQYAVVDNTVPAPYVKWHQNVISKGAAAAANLPPASYTGPTQATGVVPVPMDPALVPAGYTLTGTITGLQLIANTPASPATTATDPAEAKILEGVEEILTEEGLPPV